MKYTSFIKNLRDFLFYNRLKLSLKKETKKLQRFICNTRKYYNIGLTNR